MQLIVISMRRVRDSEGGPIAQRGKVAYQPINSLQTRIFIYEHNQSLARTIVFAVQQTSGAGVIEDQRVRGESGECRPRNRARLPEHRLQR